MPIVYRKLNYRVYKINGVYVILDNRGRDCGRFDRLGLAIFEIEQMTKEQARVL